MKGQQISVYNPFNEVINPTQYDSYGGEYDNFSVIIQGIVSGQNQEAWSGHELYNQHIIVLKSWKLKSEAEFNRSHLIVFRSVEKSRFNFKEIPKFSAVEFNIYHNKEKTRAVLIGGEIIISPNEIMIKEIEFVKTAEPLLVENIGEFEFNQDLQNFHRNIKWLDQEIEISIQVATKEQLTDEMETLKYLIENQEKINKSMIKYAIDNILKARNESWIESDEEIMDKQTFVKFSKLERISIELDGNFSFEFAEEENIFNGGWYIIDASIKEGPQSHNIL